MVDVLVGDDPPSLAAKGVPEVGTKTEESCTPKTCLNECCSGTTLAMVVQEEEDDDDDDNEEQEEEEDDEDDCASSLLWQ